MSPKGRSESITACAGHHANMLTFGIHRQFGGSTEKKRDRSTGSSCRRRRMIHVRRAVGSACLKQQMEQRPREMVCAAAPQPALRDPSVGLFPIMKPPSSGSRLEDKAQHGWLRYAGYE
jgi:hypothetical protein